MLKQRVMTFKKIIWDATKAPNALTIGGIGGHLIVGGRIPILPQTEET